MQSKVYSPMMGETTDSPDKEWGWEEVTNQEQNFINTAVTGLYDLLKAIGNPREKEQCFRRKHKESPTLLLFGRTWTDRKAF